MISLDRLVTILTHLEVARYIAVASLTVVVYDCFITFSEEIALVWYAPLSWLKLLFLLNRYVGPIMLMINAIVLSLQDMSENLCAHWFRLEGWGLLSAVAIVQVILVTRVSALYDKRAHVAWFLSILLICHVVSTSIILVFALRELKPLTRIGQVSLGCFSPTVPKFFFSVWIPSILLDAVLFFMTAAKVIQAVKGNWEKVPLLTLVVRDGMFYFATMFAVTFTATLCWLLAPATLMKAAVSPTLAVSSIAGCRLILNLRSLSPTATTGSDEGDDGPNQVQDARPSKYDLGDLELNTVIIPPFNYGQSAHQLSSSRVWSAGEHKVVANQQDTITEELSFNPELFLAAGQRSRGESSWHTLEGKTQPDQIEAAMRCPRRTIRWMLPHAAPHYDHVHRIPEGLSPGPVSATALLEPTDSYLRCGGEWIEHRNSPSPQFSPISTASDQVSCMNNSPSPLLGTGGASPRGRPKLLSTAALLLSQRQKG